jgi:hypothetical protein
MWPGLTSIFSPSVSNLPFRSEPFTVAIDASVDVDNDGRTIILKKVIPSVEGITRTQ